MKKKILLAAAVVICLTIAVSGTLAYFTFEDTAHNVITSGGVSIEVVEKTKSTDGAELEDFPKEGITGVMPGTEVSKIVSVRNTGNSEAWVRVKVDATITPAEAEGEEKLPSDVMTYTVSGDWTHGTDGYYYYNNKVPAGESTSILFDTVKFDPEMGNEYQNCRANIVISAQAVQTANNGTTVMDAQGWPAGE